MASTGLHSHHAVQVIVTTKPVEIVDGEGAGVRARRAVVPANHAHRLVADGQQGVAVYLDPATLTRQTIADSASAWAAAAVTTPVATGTAVDDPACLARRVATELGARTTPSPSTIILNAMALARETLPAVVRVVDVAASVGLSRSRLSHRFTTEVGLPMRRWVLWERLRASAVVVASGATLTEAAHAAGFADSAHLNRAFRQMFGIAPSDIAGHVSWHLVATNE